MRFMIKASLPVEAGNAAIKDGKFSKIIQSILADLKPEAAYFLEDNGKRTAILFCDLQEPSQLPAVAEPWFLAFQASVEFHPAMTAADLAKAGPSFEQTIKKYA